jgi:riboflavin-specific deaminase-like protein
VSQLPFITISYAQSLDGRIATATGRSRWISGPETLKLAHRLRGENDVIVVGIGTVLQDDPELTCRMGGGKSPVRAILDSHLRTPVGSKIVRSCKEVPTVVFSCKPVDENRRKVLQDRGVDVRVVASDDRGRISIRDAMGSLGESGYGRIFVEGGAATITSFLGSGLVDRMLVVTAPIILGQGISAVGDLRILEVDSALKPREVSVEWMGKDLVWDLSFSPRAARQQDEGVRNQV